MTTTNQSTPPVSAEESRSSHRDIASTAQVTMLAFGALGTIASTAVFTMWASLNDDIYFAAVEIGQQGTFPPGHFVYGWFAAATTASFAALTISAAWLRFVRKSPTDRWWKAVWLGLAALLAGAGIPAVIHYYILGMPLIVIGILGLVGLAIATRSKEGER